MDPGEQQKIKSTYIKTKSYRKSFHHSAFVSCVIDMKESIKPVGFVSSFPFPGSGVPTMNHAFSYHRGSVQHRRPSPRHSICLIRSIWGHRLITSRQFSSTGLYSCRPFANSAVICCSTVSWQDLTPLVHACTHMLALGVGDFPT